MNIPENICLLYQSPQRTEHDEYWREAVRWAVAGWIEAEHKQDSWHLSGHNCSKCIRENIWLAEAEAKLMEPVKEAK